MTTCQRVDEPTRRAVVAGAAAALAGCAFPGPPGDPDDSNSGSGQPDSRETVVCRSVTRERRRTIYDELDTWGAGDSYTWSIDLDAGEQVLVRVVTVDGARADLEVRDPDGETVVDTGPTSPLERTYTAATDGTHYFILTNEAFLTSGQWDATITVREEYTDQVCD